MPDGDCSNQREAQPVSIGSARRLDTSEALKQTFGIGRGNARTVILERYLNCILRCPR